MDFLELQGQEVSPFGLLVMVGVEEHEVCWGLVAMEEVGMYLVEVEVVVLLVLQEEVLEEHPSAPVLRDVGAVVEEEVDAEEEFELFLEVEEEEVVVVVVLIQ